MLLNWLYPGYLLIKQIKFDRKCKVVSYPLHIIGVMVVSLSKYLFLEIILLLLPYSDTYQVVPFENIKYEKIKYLLY